MIETRTLSNGITIVMEQIPYVKSVTFGVWVKTGSIDETAAQNGISHFIEHMVFKGTKTRTAADIAQEMDCIGGQMNAFTGKENTCFYAKTLDAHLEVSIALLHDMLFHSRFAKQDIRTEQRVVSEEIDMCEDTPDELVMELLDEQVWSGSGLARPILGTKETLGRLDAAALFSYMRQHYRADHIVLSVVGNLEFDAAAALLEQYFGQEPLPCGQDNALPSATFHGGTVMRQKDIEQTHLCLCYPGICSTEDGHNLAVVNAVLGGAMGSRLFQKVREERGLVYTISSFLSAYQQGGQFCIYAASNPSNCREVIRLVRDEVQKLLEDGLPDDEIQKAKEQLKGSYILGMESTSSRMIHLGRSQLVIGRVKTQEEVLEKFDQINRASVQAMIQRVFGAGVDALSVVGALPDDISEVCAL